MNDAKQESNGAISAVIGKVLGFVLTTLFFVVMIAAPFFIVAGLVFLICNGFGYTWSWDLAFGVCAAIILLTMVADLLRGKK